MPEPLIRSEHLVGSWDPDSGGWSARDFTPGPAGSAGIELPGGVEVDVDVAAPTTLAGLWAPGVPEASFLRASDETTDTLVELLGRERTAELLGMSKAEGPPRRLRAGPTPFDHPDELVYRGSARGQRRAGVEVALARMALALDATADPSATPLSGALATLDAALAADELGERVDFPDRARRLARHAADQLLAAAADDALDGQPVSEYELVQALRDVLPLLEGAAERGIRSLSAEIERGDVDLLDDRRGSGRDGIAASQAWHPAMTADAEVRHLRPEPRRGAGAVLDVVDLGTLPARLSGARVVARATTISEIELRVHDHAVEAEGSWARAFSPDGVIVAAAPLRAAGDDAVARLLVPAALLRTVTVDVTDTPGQPRPPAGLRAVAGAVALGRMAARSERRGDWQEARARWQATADAWRRAGDPARAGLATEYALGRAPRERSRVPPPLLADTLLDDAHS